MEEKSLFYTLALTLTKGIGPVSAKKLIQFYGNAENIFKEGKKLVRKNKLIQPKLVDELFSTEPLKLAEVEMDFICRFHIDTLYFLDDNYPYRLRLCPDSPVILFSKGNVNFNELKCISIVGTRRATEYGREITSSLISALHGEPVVIVSGLAHGIDTYAHTYALQNKLHTIAVLGHGLQTIYPAVNRNLAKQIIENGALVTEFSSQTIAEKENFPRRNRIIAGLSDAVIVVEANTKGGALITAEIALTYNRDVFAIPGKTSDTYSKGCNWLIKTNKAGLITTAEDLYYAMNWEMRNSKKSDKQISFALNEDEEKVYRILQEFNQCNIDFICNKLLFSLSKTASVLLNMEMAGVIKSLPGKMYRIN